MRRRTLPRDAPPLVREHRLYQADWLMRFYGFTADELTAERCAAISISRSIRSSPGHCGIASDFPVDLNAAPREMLLRVPGIGVRSVDRILAAAPASSPAHSTISRRLRVSRCGARCRSSSSTTIRRAALR